MSPRLFYALAAMAVAQTSVQLARPATSYRLLALGEDARTVGLVAAAFALLPLFLAIPLGRFSDRRGGPLLAVGCAVQVVAVLLLGLAGTTLGIAGASVLLGLGHLALALGVQAVIARESAADRHDSHFGLMTAGVALGQLLGPLLGGFLLGSGTPDLEATSRTMFVGAAVAAIATAFAIAAEATGRATAYSPAAGVPPRGSVRTLLATRGVPAGIFASIAVLTAADVFTAYMPVLGEQHGLDPSTVGIILALRGAASMVARLGIGPLVARVGRLRLITVSAAAAAAALAGVTFTSDPVVLGLLALVAGAGLGFGQPLSMTIVVQLVPQHARATALALRLSGNRLGQVAVPATAGIVAGGAGVGAVFWLLVGILVASGVAMQRPAVAERAARRDGRPEAAAAETALE